MVLHNPLGDLDEHLAQDLVMLRDFVDHRGLELAVLDNKAFPWHRRRTAQAGLVELRLSWQ